MKIETVPPTEGTANEGNLLFWDKDHGDANEGRLAVATGVAQGTTGPQTPAYHIVGAFEGSETDADTAEVNLVGNIRVESEEIYIWV